MFVRIALDHPSLLYESTERLSRNIEAGARLLNVSREAFIAAACRAPAWLYVTPKRLARNFHGAARAGPVPESVRAARPQGAATPLLQARTLAAKLTDSASALQLTPAQFRRAVLRRPSLLYTRPVTFAAKRKLLLTLCRWTTRPLVFPEIVEQNPIVLTFSDDYLKARIRLARQHPGRWSFHALLTTTNARLERSRTRRETR